MSKYKYILFDLDGTISESAIGIRESLEHTIAQLGCEMPNLDDYTLYIGPPLLDTFLNLCHLSIEKSREGVELYRQYYDTVGKYKNRLYDGMKEVLATLKADGYKIAVCTSKFEKFAEDIVEILGITDLLDAVCGSTLDGKRKDKKDLIPYAVETLGGSLEDKDSIVMLGDTYFDTRGAMLCGVDFIGVEYGYGSIEQMKKEGAAVFAQTTYDIIDIIRN